MENHAVFTKEEILEAKQFSNKKDLIVALLKDGERYTIPEAENMLNKFLKGVVR